MGLLATPTSPPAEPTASRPLHARHDGDAHALLIRALKPWWAGHAHDHDHPSRPPCRGASASARSGIHCRPSSRLSRGPHRLPAAFASPRTVFPHPRHPLRTRLWGRGWRTLGSARASSPWSGGLSHPQPGDHLSGTRAWGSCYSFAPGGRPSGSPVPVTPFAASFRWTSASSACLRLAPPALRASAGPAPVRCPRGRLWVQFPQRLRWGRDVAAVQRGKLPRRAHLRSRLPAGRRHPWQ
mmetsp:Transcript_69910/g.208330  ORF Transcript_69910/g.208330 Transcript_69910/m.208330 type:complete len:240 (-) Transcript_69910:28-747(-)